MTGITRTIVLTSLFLVTFPGGTTAASVKLDDQGGAHLRSRSIDLGEGQVQSQSRFVAMPKAEQNLRICNGYAWTKPLDVYHMASTMTNADKPSNFKLTGDDPLPYKSCRDFKMPLDDGDEIEFKSGELEVGTFFATGLPTSDASLLLIAHRRDATSMAVQFDSHAFAELQTAQIAVVDAYKGKNPGTLRIGDQKPHPSKGSAALAETSRMPSFRESEDLKYNSVVALNPGKYSVSLVGAQEQVKAEYPIDVKNQVNYVVMRVGTGEGKGDANTGSQYPEEVIVFPQAGAHSVHLSFLVACIMAAVLRTGAFF